MPKTDIATEWEALRTKCQKSVADPYAYPPDVRTLDLINTDKALARAILLLMERLDLVREAPDERH
jgi:hypothetical protein